MFTCDRFFIGDKNDVDKISLPVSTMMLRKFFICVDHAYINAYAYHFFPFLKAIWNLVNRDFTYAVIRYCKTKEEENIRLPRIVLRAYAMVCVYMYTHILIMNSWDVEYDDGQPFALINLFRNKNFRSNKIISKIVLGNLHDSNLANDFKEELRKISLNLPSVQGYTYSEYLELVNFCKEELKKPNLVGLYPYKILNNKDVHLDKDMVAKVLLKEYGDEKEIKLISDMIDDRFDSPKRNIYGKLTSVKINNKLREAILVSGVFDRDMNAIDEYFINVAKYRRIEDGIVWKQATRHLNIYLFWMPLTSTSISTVYHFMLAVEKTASNELSKSSEGEILQSLAHLSKHVPSNYTKKIQNVRSAMDFLILIEEIVNEIIGKKTVKEAQTFIKGLNRIRNRDFATQVNQFLQTGKFVVNYEDVLDFDSFITLLEMLYKKKYIASNIMKLKEMCFDELWRKVVLQIFLEMSLDGRVEFFSMKNVVELWFYYVPYCVNDKSNAFVAPAGSYGTWPQADRENNVAFAGCIKLIGDELYLSVEFSAKDKEKAHRLIQSAGYVKNSLNSFVRLLTKRIPIKGELGIETAV